MRHHLTAVRVGDYKPKLVWFRCPRCQRFAQRTHYALGRTFGPDMTLGAVALTWRVSLRRWEEAHAARTEYRVVPASGQALMQSLLSGALVWGTRCLRLKLKTQAGL